MKALIDLYQNMSLRKRLMLGFLVPVALLVVIGQSSVIALRHARRGLETVYLDRVVPLRGLKAIADGYAVDVIDVVNKCNGGLTDAADSRHRLTDARQRIHEQWSLFLATELTSEEVRLSKEAESRFTAANADVDKVVAYLGTVEGPCAGKLALFDGALYRTVDPIGETIAKLIDLQLREAKREYDVAGQRYWTMLWWIVSLAALSALGAGITGWFIARGLIGQLGGEPSYAIRMVRRIAQGDLSQDIDVASQKPSLLGDMRSMQDQLRAFIDAQTAMSVQHKRGEVDTRMDAQRFPGTFGEMAASLNSLVDVHTQVSARVVDLMGQYAVGDLSRDMDALPGKLSAISDAMATAKANLVAVNRDIERLVNAAACGDFTARGDADDYQFAFRAMVEGLNRLMHAADSGLRDVGGVLEALAAGDLSRQLDGQYQGAFGSLAASVNATARQLGAIVTGIQAATGAIHAASSEIAAGNDDLSARTEQQAASLEETAASMEELTSTVRQNAENARQASRAAESASEVATKAGSAMTNVVSTMNDIHAASRTVVDIITVIDGIAFQTNILALNAAVEAARGGTQGRGFAVVATEVRELAKRSAAAAKQIKELIEASAEKVSTGARLVNETGSTMAQVVDAVRRVSDLVADISSASAEQSVGIEQVTQAITHMDQNTQQNAALVEEATSAARSLEEQANGLSKAVSTFKLARDDANDRGAQRGVTLLADHGVGTRKDRFVPVGV